MTERYTSARFWKCSLQVNPEGYSRTYRGQDHGLTGESFLAGLLQACKDAKVEVIGLADHGRVQDVDAIRDHLRAHDIVVFPGFEVASTEKVHWVCLFPEDTTTEQLNRILGNLELLDPEDGVRPSRLGGQDLLSRVADNHGFCYAAHATNRHGILAQKCDHLWKDPQLRAAQVPGPVDDLPSEFKQIARNQDPAYRRETPVALINAKDIAKPDDLSDRAASCFVKMTRPTFESFLTAFKDPESRVRRHDEISEQHYSRIQRMRIIGGYLDGVDIEFSGHLNTAIGGRGTGKSTLLECLRYALDIEHKGTDAQRQGERIVSENLGRSAGRIELDVVSASNNMQQYRVIRRYAEPPRVQDENGHESSLHPRDLLPRVEIYGQNEIYELARNNNALVRVIERFLPNPSVYEQRVTELRSRLTENASDCLRALNNKDKLEQALARLPKLTERVEQFKTLGLEEQLRRVPLLERERQLQPRIDAEVTRLGEAVQSLSDSLPDVAFLSDKALQGLPHATLIKQARQALEKLQQAAKQALDDLNAAIETCRAELQSFSPELVKSLDTAERDLDKEFSKLPRVAGKRGPEIGRTYQALQRDIQAIKPQETTLRTTQTLVDSLDQQRRDLLGELSDLRSERSQTLQQATKRLSKRLRGKLQVRVIPNGNRDTLKQLLCRLPNISERRAAWVDEAEDLSIPALVNAIQSGADALRDAGWGITTVVADTLAKLGPAEIMELEVIDMEDRVDVQLNISHGGDNYRSLAKLSTGQQCTAILHLLLLDNADPLIMDQPEDNLDNAFIAERIVRELRNAKMQRQFLFATHNANIPVFGDAEWIGVFHASEDHGEMPSEAQGSIDVPAIRDEVAGILEGGKAAFIQRKEKYGF